MSSFTEFSSVHFPFLDVSGWALQLRLLPDKHDQVEADSFALKTNFDGR